MGKTDKKSKNKHKHNRKEHKEKHIKDKVRKSKKNSKNKYNDKEQKILPKTQVAAPKPASDNGSEEDFAIPIALMNSKSHAPETPEEYQRRQSQIRREVDPVTGRLRLIKGDSEVLEEIVTKVRHNEINKKATNGDGVYYETQSLTAAAAKRK